MSSPELALANLQAQLPGVHPLLFNLADQLLAAAPTAEWNVLISDDTSARLPGYFVRSVLSHAGYRMPTHFVAGSKAVQARLGAEPYKRRIESIAQQVGAPVLRPLIFTESVGSGQTINFLRDTMSEHADHIETAAVASRVPATGNLTYVGGVGEEASYDVYYAFESSRNATNSGRLLGRVIRHTPKTVKRFIPRSFKQTVNDASQGNSFLGLYNDPEAELPIASRALGYTTAYLGYQAMRSLAAEYAATRVIDIRQQIVMPDVRDHEPIESLAS